MAWDAVMRFWQKSVCGDFWPKGESQYIDDGFSLTNDWRFALENRLNITQSSGNLYTGKAQFEPFSVKKQIDKASPELYGACGAGAKFNNVTVYLFKSMGNPLLPHLNAYCIFTFNGVGVQKVEWNYEEEPQEQLTLIYGSCAIAYGRQTDLGLIIKEGVQGWNQVSNSSTITDEIEGNPAPAHQIDEELPKIVSKGIDKVRSTYNNIKSKI